MGTRTLLPPVPSPTRVWAPPDPRTALFTAPAEAARVPAARRFTRVVAARWGIPQDTRDAAELIVGELAGNAARHGRDAMNLCLRLGPVALHITLEDFGSGPSPQRPGRRGSVRARTRPRDHRSPR